jgi:iron-sulfur cluster repair protein YtfE (RIC family)
MQHLHTVNYHNFSPNELCNYLDERYYTEISHNLETTYKYLTELAENENNQTTDLVLTLFAKLDFEIKQLFAKDRILLFPHLIAQHEQNISLAPINIIHQKIINLLQKIRELMNNYVQQPTWSTTYKICCNELYGLEQLIHYVFYVKENFLWTRINTAI